MGNSIGIDISGTLIRVSCVCLPRDPDEHQKRTSAGIWEALEKPKQENKKRNCYRNQSIKSMKQDVNYNSEDQRNHHGGPNCCYYEDDSPHYHSFRETPNVSLSDRGTCKTDPKDFASFSNHEFQQNHENPIYRNFNVIHSDDHYQVLNPHISSDQDAPCPYRQFFHNDATPQEVAIKNYLDSAPLWGPPRTFCFSHYGPYPGKAFCFVIDLNDAEDALRKVRHKSICMKQLLDIQIVIFRILD